MKTIKTVAFTIIVTLAVVMVGIIGFLLKMGIVTIQTRDVNHTKQVVIDGVVAETTEWTETEGVKVAIDVVDGVYFDFND